jgi:glycosyltransferase involved in cell wall biosynthesis
MTDPDHFRVLAARLGIVDRLHFWLERSDGPELVAAMDVFLMPSRRERFAVTIPDAMWSELPVIASAVDGIGEVLDAEHAYYLVTPGDVYAPTIQLQRS